MLKALRTIIARSLIVIDPCIVYIRGIGQFQAGRASSQEELVDAGSINLATQCLASDPGCLLHSTPFTPISGSSDPRLCRPPPHPISEPGRENATQCYGILFFFCKTPVCHGDVVVAREQEEKGRKMEREMIFRTRHPKPTTLSVSLSWMAKMALVGVFCLWGCSVVFRARKVKKKTLHPAGAILLVPHERERKRPGSRAGEYLRGEQVDLLFKGVEERRGSPPGKRDRRCWLSSCRVLVVDGFTTRTLPSPCGRRTRGR